MTTFPPAAEAFGALVGVLQRALRDHGKHALYFSNRSHGGTSITAVNTQGKSSVDTGERSAHQQIAWAALEREAHIAYKVFQKACQQIPHLRPQAKCLAFTVTGPRRALLAWEWENLDFTQGITNTCAPTYSLGYVQKAIAAVETEHGAPQPVLFHNRQDNLAIGRANWPVDAASSFVQALCPRGQQGIVGFQQVARFSRAEARHGFQATTPEKVGVAFRTLMRTLQAAPAVVLAAHMEWSNGQLWPTLELSRKHSDKWYKVFPSKVWNHPRLEGSTWLADCSTAVQTFHQAIKAQAPCMAKVLMEAPLAAGFLHQTYPYVHLFGMQIHQQEGLCFLGYPPETLRAFHTTQGGAQHLDIPAPTAEQAAAFVRAKRNNGQLIEVWTAL